MTQFTWRYADTFEYLERVRVGFPPAMICVAVNGGIQGKEYNPALPETVEEIAESTHQAYLAGACMVHVHARDSKNPTQGARSVTDWAAVIQAIRARCPDIIVNATTGGDLTMSMEERLSCLGARPDLASLNLTPDMSRFRIKARKAPLPHPRDVVEIDACVPFTYGQIERFAAEMSSRGIKPELETYHTGGAQVIRTLISGGFVQPPYFVQTVMGAQTASYPTPDNLIQLVRELPERTVWLASGIGPHQLQMTTMALLMGGHVRVGLEDNVYERRGTLLRSNADAVARVVRIARELNRGIATPAEARTMLGLASVDAAHPAFATVDSF